MAIDGDDGAGGGADAGAGGAADLLGDAAAAAAGAGDQGGGDQGGAGGGTDGGAADVADPEFYGLLSAEAGEGDDPSNRDWIKAKGFKDPDSVIKSLRAAEKAIHDRGAIKLPGEGAKAEEIAAFRAAIGVPDKVEGYEVKAPDDLPLNEPVIGKLRESALKHGAPKGVFEGLVTDFIQIQLDEANAETQRHNQEAQDWVKEQGAAATAKMAHVDTAGRALGLTKADMNGFRATLGPKRAFDLLSKLGEGMAEDTLITGGQGRFGVTGAEAQAEMDKLKQDPEFQKRVMVPRSAEAMRWERLQAAVGAAAEAEARRGG